MKTLQEDIDDLDRMVDTGASKDSIRSQIRLISREVATLQTDYASLAENHTKLHQAHTKFNNAQMKQNEEAWNSLQKEAEEQQRIIKSHLLKHL